MNRSTRILRVLSTVILLAALFCAEPLFGQALNHPGLLNSSNELAFIKAKVLANAQPWKQAYDSLKANSHASLSYQDAPLADPVTADQMDHMTEDGAAAYADALIWYISGDQRYADKAIQILNDWSVLNTHDNWLYLSWAVPWFMNAAEILRYSSSGWTQPDIQVFNTMVRNKMLKPMQNSNWVNNAMMSTIEGQIAIAIYLDDRGEFNRAVDRWRYWTPAYIYCSTDGPKPFLPIRNGAPVDYWAHPYDLISGMCQETCRDLNHCKMGTYSVFYSAEMAWQQGVDLFSEEMKRITDFMELHAGWMTGATPVPASLCSGEGRIQCTGIASQGYAPCNTAMWEILLSQYSKRLGMNLPLSKAMTEGHRPAGLGATRNAKPETLTHADLPDLRTATPVGLIPGRIEAESYLAMSGVQTQACAEGGWQVAYVEAGDWLDYAVSVAQAGNYEVTFRVASLTNAIKLSLNSGSTVLASVDTPTTGGWSTYKTVTNTVALDAGGQTLRLLATGSGWNLNWLEFAMLPVAGPDVIYGDTNDCEVQFTLSTPPYAIADLTTPGLLSGTAGSTGKERCPVFVFKLPNFGAATNPFTTAAFTFNFASKDSTVLGNVDIYGLARRASPTVLTNDYWTATATPDTDATFLQDNIITANSMAYGLKTNASVALLNYLNAQYADGAGAGQYVFLRLSTDAAQTGGASRYNLTSTEGAGGTNFTTWPQINYTVTATTNNPPTLAAITNRTLVAGQTLLIPNVATDADTPAQSLRFSLLNPPAGATVDTNTGLFTWRPTLTQSPSTNPFSLKVADNGSPSLSATQAFFVTVLRPARPVVSAPGFSNGAFNFTVAGDDGPDYTIQASTNLTAWLPVWTNSSPLMPFPFYDASSTNFNQRFYRVLLGP